MHWIALCFLHTRSRVCPPRRCPQIHSTNILLVLKSGRQNLTASGIQLLQIAVANTQLTPKSPFSRKRKSSTHNPRSTATPRKSTSRAIHRVRTLLNRRCPTATHLVLFLPRLHPTPPFLGSAGCPFRRRRRAGGRRGGLNAFTEALGSHQRSGRP